MTTIAVIINARTSSSRLPRKLVLPFAGTTLIDIALEKLDRMHFFAHRYFAAAEPELLDRAAQCDHVEVLARNAEAVRPGYNDHRKVFAHYEQVMADYIFWLNPCHPLLSIETVEMAARSVLETRHNSYTSVVPTTDWIFDESGHPVTNKEATMLSTAHSQKFFKVAHAFHAFDKKFFLKEYQCWTLTENDPAMLEIPIEESYDVNDEIEFRIAEYMYERQQAGPRALIGGNT
jgi:CMP-N-acetylneuraminic acid synthetase